MVNIEQTDKSDLVAVIYNASYGGAFGEISLSDAALKLGAEISGNAEWFDHSDISRTNVVLLRVMLELGADAGGCGTDLKIRLLPRGTRYRISRYDEAEHVITFDEEKWEIAK